VARQTPLACLPKEVHAANEHPTAGANDDAKQAELEGLHAVWKRLLRVLTRRFIRMFELDRGFIIFP